VVPRLKEEVRVVWVGEPGAEGLDTLYKVVELVDLVRQGGKLDFKEVIKLGLLQARGLGKIGPDLLEVGTQGVGERLKGGLRVVTDHKEEQGLW